jgi:perosamine synthetase
MSEPTWRFQGNELAYIQEVLNRGFRAGADGAFSTKFELEFARIYNQKYAIAFNSGTTTLHASLLALGCGSGDEVLVPALTPLMCGLAIHYTGATPVYVDSNPDTFLMDVEDLKKKITAKTKIIMIVHMYGGVCDTTSIKEIADRHGLKILEDCAQCHFGRNESGTLAGTSGDVGSWSFENSKQLTCGDGGIVTTNNVELARRIRKIGGLGFKTLTAKSGAVRTNRDSLQNPDWERFDEIGYNYRMNQLAAAVALAQVERNDEFINLRVESANNYKEAIGDSALLTPQFQPKDYFYTYYTYSVKFNGTKYNISWSDFRKKYMEFGGDGIYAASKLMYQEPIFRDLGIGYGNAPIAEELQLKLMNFTTNQANLTERQIQAGALKSTLNFFGV